MHDKFTERVRKVIYLAREEAARIEQLLEELIVAGETDLIIEAQFACPERQSGLNRFGGKGSADGDHAIVERHVELLLWPMPRFGRRQSRIGT